MAKPATREQCEQAVEALKKHGSQAKAAKALGIPRQTLQSRLALHDEGRFVEQHITQEDIVAEAVALFKKHGAMDWTAYQKATPHPMMHRKWWDAWAEFKEHVSKLAGIEDTLTTRERQRYQDRIRSLETELRIANRELNQREDYRSSLFDITSQPIKVPGWALTESRPGADSELPMLHASDWQIGEVVTSARTGFNDFNKDVADERIRLMVAKTIELSFNHRGKKRYPGIYYMRGGDMISGEIHDDLTETNDLQSIPATKWLVERETWVIRELRKAFGKVHVLSVPGNHGRSTEKPRTKRDADDNFDVLSHHWLESMFQGDMNVSFNAPSTGDALFDIYGYNLCLTHGDRIGSRGGQGYIGAVATITRGMKKCFEYYATLGHVIDYFFVGHFHVALNLEYGYSNGSLPGYSEYAKDFRMRPHPPSQNLLYMHPHYGVADVKQLILAKRPKLAEMGTAPFMESA